MVLTGSNGGGIPRSIVDEKVSGVGIQRIVASTNPDMPLNDGDLLLVYEPSPTAFSTDFADGLTGWTTRWNFTDSWTAEADATATSGLVASTESTTSARHALTIDAMDGASADVEILARTKNVPEGTEDSAAHCGLLVRGGSETASADNYYASIWNSRLNLSRTVSGSYTNLAAVALASPIAADTWFWMRFQVNGDQLMANVWADGEVEPDGWMVSATDTQLTAPGWIGLFASSSAEQAWDVVAVALDGATAAIT